MQMIPIYKPLMLDLVRLSSTALSGGCALAAAHYTAGRRCVGRGYSVKPRVT